jgi:hypothetical protein
VIIVKPSTPSLALCKYIYLFMYLSHTMHCRFNNSHTLINIEAIIGILISFHGLEFTDKGSKRDNKETINWHLLCWLDKRAIKPEVAAQTVVVRTLLSSGGPATPTPCLGSEPRLFATTDGLLTGHSALHVHPHQP